MRQFTGSEGDVYLLGEQFSFFDEQMSDCGDGFDWQVEDASLRFWPEGSSLRVEVYESGEWCEVQVRDVEAATGRVSLGRCFSGAYVRASGQCRLLTRIGPISGWTLLMEGDSAADMTTYGADDRETVPLPGQPRARINAAIPSEAGEMLVVLKSPPGALVGCASVAADTGIVEYNEKGVDYVLC